MAVLNIADQVLKAAEKLPSYDYMLGRTLMEPFRPANSSQRSLMNSVHSEHLMVPLHGQTPLVQTGFENEFGRNSSSYVESDGNYEVIAKVSKFENLPNHIYYLITRNLDTGEYDVIQRTPYHHNTESYGYMFNNKILDAMDVGSRIHKDELLKCSTGFDGYLNKINGCNLLTMYMSSAQTMEDSIQISESAAKMMATQLVKKTSITINDNDVLLNLYGDDNIHKTFPDIGEKVRNGIFASIRRIEKSNILFSLSKNRLKDIMISDRNILIDGVVYDIDIHCNNPDIFKSNKYNGQMQYYYNQKIKFCQTIIDIVGPLAMNGRLSYNLNTLYGDCRDILGGKQYFKEKQFNNIIMDVVVIKELPMETGDKMADRYGGKGVISKIVPDELMPLLDNGKRVDIIKNQSTCINRENIGQLHEQSLNFISMRIIDAFKSGNLSYREMFDIYCRYVSLVEPNEANYVIQAIDKYDDEQLKLFIESIIADDGIILSVMPFTSNVDIDLIERIYDEFPWIKPYNVLVPMTNSNGDIRYVPTRRPLVCGKIYNYRLKQYAADKFSVTSLSATNLRGLNIRSRAKKAYETRFAKTPIMFGQMETGNMAHFGMQYVVMNLMLYSASPQARRLFEQLLIGDPYDIDIKLDRDSKNRNAEIVNVLLKTMGIKLVFEKRPKEKTTILENMICEVVPNHQYKPYGDIRNRLMSYDDKIKLQYDAVERYRNRLKPILTVCVCDDIKGEERDDNKG